MRYFRGIHGVETTCADVCVLELDSIFALRETFRTFRENREEKPAVEFTQVG
jgi:hypothetical protein